MAPIEGELSIKRLFRTKRYPFNGPDNQDIQIKSRPDEPKFDINWQNGEAQLKGYDLGLDWILHEITNLEGIASRPRSLRWATLEGSKQIGVFSEKLPKGVTTVKGEKFELKVTRT